MHCIGVKRVDVISRKLKNLLKQYEEGKATPAERRAVDIWYESFSSKKEDSPIWENPAAREAMRKRIWDNVQPLRKQPSWFRQHRKLFAGLSAAALLTVAFLWHYTVTIPDEPHPQIAHNNDIATSTFTTGSKERKLVTLPDSSRVWLNANSTLSIAAGYGGEFRQVAIDGEAFFDVVPNPQKIFVVKTSHLNIQVLGTAFNVQAYAGATTFRVGVAHGKVAVQDKVGMTLNQLTQGQMLSYNTHDGNNLTRSIAGVGSWRDGRIVLEEASFEELAQAIYNIYGVRLRNERQSGKHYSYNLQIHSNRSLAQTLDIICRMHRTNYRRENDEIILY
ncbi:anti-sigma factor [Sphingobacterium griseoflavum]|uniref:Anti-sigma factor n=1 Tax=Sphingobacterium griseoflavum TaxID=1474952 RepID=A0ABQ3HYG9_9SPHI|nr:anti-sigma factor [Sphingobacterium griseoflavum]